MGYVAYKMALERGDMETVDYEYEWLWQQRRALQEQIIGKNKIIDAKDAEIKYHKEESAALTKALNRALTDNIYKIGGSE